MKNSAFLAFAFFSMFSFSLNAQVKKCITEEKMQELFRSDPQARIRFENTRRMLDDKVRAHMSNPDARLFRTNAIINIPVVVHIMTSNPNQVTNAIVQSQIDTLNWYYGGAPAGDSLRVYTPFRTSYGRSQIRFCLAQRTPAGIATNGIERLTTATTFNGSSAHPSTIVPAWNTQNYMNMWVVSFGNSGILGYSYKPGTFAPGSQNIGYVVDYRAFGSGPGTSSGGFHFDEYNQGKTGVHEIGHYFNLDHTWGPNNNGNPTCTLDDGCSDTPIVNGPFFGCPIPSQIPVLSTSCSGSAPGAMWQNHMDYADDACMVLFTQQQVAKMETALNNSTDRSTLIVSNGCQPLAVSTEDAGISAILTPVNSSTYCAPAITPQVTLRNFSSSNLTAVSIILTINGNVQSGYPFAWTGNLAPGASINVTLPQINLVSGTNTVIVSTSLPNGLADANISNDASTVIVNLPALQSAPVIEGFENNFPPTGWSVINPNNNATWIRKTPGRNSTYSAYIDNFTNGVTNQTDDLRSPFINVVGADSLTINFDLAHKNYNAAANSDTLTVLISNDCGNTYTPVYKKWGAGLATAGSLNTNYAAPAPGDWRNERISLNNVFTATGTANILIRNTSRFGNNIFIDNINISTVYKRDAQLLSINNPSTLLCNGSVTPSVTIRNAGIETITGLKVSYSLDNGAVQTTTYTGINLTSNSQINVNLTTANIVTLGAHTIKIYSWEPVTLSGTGDMNTANDTLSRNFSIAGSANAPLTESFEGASFPPANWTVTNPDGNITWKRNAAGNGNIGSAFMNTFNYAAQGQKDDLASPNVNFTGVDSVQLSFDLAAATYSHPGTTGIPLDTLEVLVTKDCGATYTTVYKKWGEDLQTVSDPNNPNPSPFTPVNAEDWRKEIIDLTAFGPNGPLMFVFRTTNNFENNIFIDNVNLTTRVLPEIIKQQGYLVLPSPFRNSFGVWHVQQPTALKYINVFNAAGQLIWTRKFDGNAQKVEMIDLTGKAAGVYLVNIGYTDSNRNITERVVKY